MLFIRGTSLGLILLAGISLSAADSPLRFNRLFGGSGTENVTAIATDRSGNVIAAGVTSSYDFPVTEGSRNVATHFAVSSDGGGSWNPLGNLPSGTPLSFYVDTSQPPVWYAPGRNGLFKSVDGGTSWIESGPHGLPRCNSVGPNCAVFLLAIDPASPATIYATSSVGILKTTNGGATWLRLPQPLENPNPPSYIVLDPFHPGHVFTSVAFRHFRSFDGGQTWSEYTPPLLHPNNSCSSGGALAPLTFDAATPGTAYLVDHCDLFRSTDGGINWDPVSTPFRIAFVVAAHPSRAGIVYAVGSNGLYKTSDGGASWSLVLPDENDGGTQVVAFDPSRPRTVLTDKARSDDDGASWIPLSLGRHPIQITFDPAHPGRAIAATEGLPAGFVAILNSAGDLLSARYLSGPGGASLSGIATDRDANIYVTGSLNTTARTHFAAKLDFDLKLIYSIDLPGLASTNAIAVDSAGSALIAATSNTQFRCRVIKLQPDGSAIAFSAGLDDRAQTCTAVASDSAGNAIAAGATSTLANSDAWLVRLDPSGILIDSHSFGGSDSDSANAIALDAAGNIYVAGSTGSRDFPVSDGAYQTKFMPNCPYPSGFVSGGFFTIINNFTGNVFVTKFDPAWNVVYSTYLGGTCFDTARSIAVDAAGNAWITGNSNSNPFPQANPVESGPPYGAYKAILAQLDSTGAALNLSSYFTGAGPIAVDTFGNTWVGGSAGGHASVAQLQPPLTSAVTITSAGNAFALRDGPVSPGQITQISVSGLNPDNAIDLTLTPANPLPRTLAGAQVLFDGEPAAIVSVAPGRIVALAPYDLAGKRQTSIQVVFQGAVSPPVLADVTADHAYLSADGSGTGQAFALNPDGTVNSASNPAPPGSRVTVYTTGIGLADPNCPEGGVASIATELSGTGYSSVPGHACGVFQIQFLVGSFGPNPIGIGDTRLTVFVTK